MSDARSSWRRALEVGAVFVRLGATAFGGPAAHIAIMRHELIERRKWLEEEHFLDLLGATNLIPGPNSSEMTMHIGYLRAGLLGLIAGGIGFLLPAMLMVLGLAWAYEEYGTTPAVEWLLYGVKPVIIPLIVLALWKLGQKAVKDRLTAVVGVAALVLYFAGLNFVLLLVGGGVLVMVLRNALHAKHWLGAVLPAPLAGLPLTAAAGTVSASASLLTIFWVFLKIGALMYGSGYVLFAFLQADVVENYGWLTEQQLIDAIAVGQMTPGPLSTSATFIGYLIAGVPGAIIATGALYLPAFVVVLISNPIVPRIRNSSWASSLLDGVNVAALGLMAAVTWELGGEALIDVFTVVTALLAVLLLLRWQVSSMWLVVLGAGMGLLHAALF